MVEHNIQFDPRADRFISGVICGSHRRRSRMCKSEGSMSEYVMVVEAAHVYLLIFVIFCLKYLVPGQGDVAGVILQFNYNYRLTVSCLCVSS